MTFLNTKLPHVEASKEEIGASTGENRAGGFGVPLLRLEDRQILAGLGRCYNDYTTLSMCHAVLVRSSHAHARIRSIDVSRALELHGILAALTGADAVAGGLRPMPHNTDWVGSPDAEPGLHDVFQAYTAENYPMLPAIVRYVGEAVALVVAETFAAATNAAELVNIDYEVLPALADARDAMLPGAPQVWPDFPNNLSPACEFRDELATTRPFEQAAHIVTFDGWAHRVTGSLKRWLDLRFSPSYGVV